MSNTKFYPQVLQGDVHFVVSTVFTFIAVSFGFVRLLCRLAGPSVTASNTDSTLVRPLEHSEAFRI